MRAYILLKVSPQETMSLMRNLKEEQGIAQASVIHGPYDCLVEVEAKDLDEINQIMLRIRTMAGVMETLTCLVVQSWRRTKP